MRNRMAWTQQDFLSIGTVLASTISVSLSVLIREALWPRHKAVGLRLWIHPWRSFKHSKPSSWRNRHAGHLPLPLVARTRAQGPPP